MDDPVNTGTRRYHAPRRAAAAAQTREAILHAAKNQFEARGWAAATVAAVAADAAVSPKTVQALFGTKAALLAAAVDYAIAGDAAEVPVIGRPSARSVESAPDAAAMLDRHAGHVVAVNARSAGLAQVVETAAGGSQRARLGVVILSQGLNALTSDGRPHRPPPITGYWQVRTGGLRS